MQKSVSTSIVSQLVADSKIASRCIVVDDCVKFDEFKVLQKEVSKLKKIERKKSWSNHKK